MKSKGRVTETETYKKAKAALLARRLKFAETLARDKASETDKASAQLGLAEIHWALREVDEGIKATGSAKSVDPTGLAPVSIPAEGRKIY